MPAPGGEALARLALHRVPGLRLGTLESLLDRHGSAEAVLAAGPRGWRAAGLDTPLCEALAAPDWAAAEADLRWLDTPHSHFIAWGDAAYPERLRELANPPLGLWCLGDAGLLTQPQLAVVGARSATVQGLENAEAFARELARCGLVVTSGLALGIDGAAHRGALMEEHGTTIAICGNGLDRVYPARHRELAHAIAARGLLVAEFPPGTPPLRENFPRRNRLISGLALGVLVVEAARDSGSLITARLAAEQGREVFAIPGSIHNPLSRGCHALIREGARLVETVQDILVELAPKLAAEVRPEAVTAPPAKPGTEPASPLLAALGADPVSFDQLIARTGLDAGRLAAELSQLELAGRVAPGPGDTYMSVKPR